MSQLSGQRTLFLQHAGGIPFFFLENMPSVWERSQKLDFPTHRSDTRNLYTGRSEKELWFSTNFNKGGDCGEESSFR